MINLTTEYLGVAKKYFSYACGSLVSFLSAGDLVVSSRYARAIKFTAASGSVLYMINGSIAVGKTSGNIGMPVSIDKWETVIGYSNVANFQFVRELDTTAASVKGTIFFEDTQ